MGIVDPKSVVQRRRIDGRLRNRLWSKVDVRFWSPLDYKLTNDVSARRTFDRIWDYFFGVPTDGISNYSSENVTLVRQWFFDAKWNEVFDFIQFMADFSKLGDASSGPVEVRRAHLFIPEVNLLLEEEKSAYRFVSGNLIEITDDNEIREIEAAISSPQPFAGSRIHLSKALSLYGDREAPDYQNAIKEAISGVESCFAAINGERSGSMAKAIQKAEANQLQLHPALKTGMLKLYGWTSDEEGIRHAMMSENQSVGENEARLMIVLCSALVNFLIATRPTQA